MRCGAKRYTVLAVIDHEKYEDIIPARTPAEARKIFRQKHGEDIEIISVRER